MSEEYSYTRTSDLFPFKLGIFLAVDEVIEEVEVEEGDLEEVEEDSAEEVEEEETEEVVVDLVFGRGGGGGSRGRGGGGRGGGGFRGGNCSEVYGEKRISVENEGDKVEYRVWNPFRSKLAAAILGGIEKIHMPPGSKVLYLGAASGTTVSHVSDIVGPEGLVYAVEFSHRSGRDLLNVAKKRTNIIPIIEDARHPHKYRMLMGMVDTIFADVAQPDQARIVALNAQHFLKNDGHFVISIKASCIDSTAKPEIVFASEVKKLKTDKLVPKEQISLEPYERDHAVVIGIYRPSPKN
ncbi:hypothetical protein NQ317_008841 [Molorchus minor]|uniref:rRNA 2'-O-methyltransferase fibrillarin n=1 Tax=Molorchus minor TaxID=1323400 RepID=A0ABQ9J7G5_9CUCU|nr:hypothetical protein NQ317_008841 [Molorchus minor]